MKNFQRFLLYPLFIIAGMVLIRSAIVDLMTAEIIDATMSQEQVEQAILIYYKKMGLLFAATGAMAGLERLVAKHSHFFVRNAVRVGVILYTGRWFLITNYEEITQYLSLHLGGLLCGYMLVVLLLDAGKFAVRRARRAGPQKAVESAAKEPEAKRAEKQPVKRLKKERLVVQEISYYQRPAETDDKRFNGEV